MTQVEEKIVFFDGVCHLCNGSVEFLIRNNPGNSLRYATLQSEFAREKLQQFGKDNQQLESILYLKGDRLFERSSAALALTAELSYPAKALGIFWIIPKFIRDWVYDIIASNRYSWFGKKKECMIPTPEQREKFIF